MPVLRSDRANAEAVRHRLARVMCLTAQPPPASPVDHIPRIPPAEPEEPVTLADPAEPDDAGDERHPGAARVAGAFGVAGASVDPGRPGMTVLAVIAGAVLLIAGGIAWWNQPRPEPVALPRPSDTATLPSPSPDGVVVAVSGKVRRPGLVTLPTGSRVADALKAAGGVLPGTDIGLLNLARKVTDGELIVVGAPPPPEGMPGGSDPGGPAGKVNLNTATLQELDTLPGVGPVLAQRIVEFREGHGGFRAVADLRQVDGIGPARYEDLKNLVTV